MLITSLSDYQFPKFSHEFMITDKIFITRKIKEPYLFSQANSTEEAPQHAGGQRMLSLIQGTDGGRGFFLLPAIF